jgi:hypothetical protein
VFTLPSELAAKLAHDVAIYIPTFKPQRLLTDEQWQRCNAGVWTSCAMTCPPSVEDAKTQMSVLCAFLAYTDQVAGSVDLDAVLTETMINRYLVASRGSAAASTLHNRQVRLRRAVRAARGDRPRQPYGNVRAKTPPYARDELRILAAAAATSDALAATLACALSGTVVPATHGTVPADTITLLAGCQRFGINSDWLAGVRDAPFTADDWQTAKTVATACGVSLTAHRLRITWLCEVLAAVTPLTVLVGELGLTRRDLDAALPHLTSASQQETHRLLRG